LSATGFRGSLLVVDANFIGKQVGARRLLGPLAAWMRAHDDPFYLYTEASLNLASDDALIDAMVAAGFSSIFIGIETPSEEALRHTQKLQNTTVDPAPAVRKLTAPGLDEVTLLEGYARLLAEIYSADGFYERALRALALCPVDPNRYRVRPGFAAACLTRSLWQQGVRSRHRGAYWRFLARAAWQTPSR